MLVQDPTRSSGPLRVARRTKALLFLVVALVLPLRLSAAGPPASATPHQAGASASPATQSPSAPAVGTSPVTSPTSKAAPDDQPASTEVSVTSTGSTTASTASTEETTAATEGSSQATPSTTSTSDTEETTGEGTASESDTTSEDKTQVVTYEYENLERNLEPFTYVPQALSDRIFSLGKGTESAVVEVVTSSELQKKVDKLAVTGWLITPALRAVRINGKRIKEGQAFLMGTDGVPEVTEDKDFTFQLLKVTPTELTLVNNLGEQVIREANERQVQRRLKEQLKRDQKENQGEGSTGSAEASSPTSAPAGDTPSGP